MEVDEGFGGVVGVCGGSKCPTTVEGGRGVTQSALRWSISCQRRPARRLPPEHVLAYSCSRDYPQGLQL